MKHGREDPSYDLRETSLDVVRTLCEKFHGYKSAGNNGTYVFAVFEDEKPIAGYVWQPPPPGAAASVCKEAPYGVLALSRMVAVPKTERRLQHVSKPLRRQMRSLIDRTRWPVLVTYSDEGQGHMGHVYRCSGWVPTLRSRRPIFVDHRGSRTSSYSNGKTGGRVLERTGTTIIQRWEHWICSPDEVARFMRESGWKRVPVPGKRWRSGNAAFTYERAS